MESPRTIDTAALALALAVATFGASGCKRERTAGAGTASATAKVAALAVAPASVGPTGTPAAAVEPSAPAPSRQACEAVVAEAVNALPEVKQALAEAEARVEASGGKLRFGGIGPQDLDAPEGFSASTGIHSDDSFETVMTYDVDRNGRLVVTAAGRTLDLSQELLATVARTCKR